jgi:diguanylate cyclase
MLANKNTETFLSNEEVQTRLKQSMIAWIEQLFVIPENPEAIEQIIQKQIQVGHVHARIDLPMNLVDFGARTLKSNITKHLLASTLSDDLKVKALSMVYQLMDTMIALINESYLNDVVINEKNAQAFRMHVTSKVLAFDCERLRSSLLDWMREVLSALCDDEVDRSTLPTLMHSDFGLWLIHKGELILVGRSELPILLKFVSVADAIIAKLSVLSASDKLATNELLSQLNDEVTQVIWVLGSISKEMQEIDNGRDSLTNLFNRRYVPTVLIHETECSIKTGMRFGILYADIDNFKQLNDKYGHDNGDLILKQFSAVLSQNARAGDFVFRYGGEEFLVVLADVYKEQLPDIAEKIRKMVEEATFNLLNGLSVPVTVSIGAALHDGHPDYERTIRSADDALYEAKHQGRNCVVVS